MLCHLGALYHDERDVGYTRAFAVELAVGTCSGQRIGRTWMVHGCLTIAGQRASTQTREQRPESPLRRSEDGERTSTSRH